MLFFKSAFADGTSKEWFWVTDDSDNFYYAATLNSSGHLIGQYCFFKSGDCKYLLGAGITCTEGNEYPALINSTSGSTHVTIICGGKVGDQNVFLLSPFDDIDSIIRNADRIGIAVPMENDKFKVSRFSLSGSTHAIESMRSSAEKKMSKKPVKSTVADEEYI